MYAVCDHIKRTKPGNEVNEDLSKQLSPTFDLLPLFEKDLFEHVFIKHYSIERNELLRCRWREYVRNIESRVFAPFQFPDMRDLHFHNFAVRLLPSATPIRHDHRMKQKPGPGVDYGGQMPIPQELHMKRGKEPAGNTGKHKAKGKGKKKMKDPKSSKN